MNNFIYLIFAIIPAILWILYFYFNDKGEKDPLRMMIFTALAGAVVVIPAAFLEFYFTKGLILLFFPGDQIAPISVYANYTWFLLVNLLMVSFIEEIFKFLAVRLTIYKSSYFDEVSDGIFYMVSAAFGFAAIENFLYFINFGESVVLTRSIFTPLFHASASAIVGHYLALSKWNNKYSGRVFWAFIGAVMLHFIYNLLIFLASMNNNYLFTAIAIIILAIAVRLMFSKFKECEELDDKCKIS